MTPPSVTVAGFPLPARLLGQMVDVAGETRARFVEPAPTRRANLRSEARLGADSRTRCVNEELSRERIGLGELGIGIILHRYGKSMAADR